MTWGGVMLFELNVQRHVAAYHSFVFWCA